MRVTDLAPHYPPEGIKEFDCRIQQIRSSGYKGSIKLLNNFYHVGDGDKEGFLNRLCEINIANRLLERNKYFEYETQGEDFAYDDILLSVKSLQPKDYERRERERLLELRAEAIRSKTIQKDTLVHSTRYSASTVDFEVTEHSYSRSETANLVNAVTPTDAIEEITICQYAAEFETVQTDQRKKVLFFMRQSDRAGAFHVEDVASWYFEQSDLNNADSSFYEKFFKTRDKVPVKKSGSIKAFMFMWHADPILWSKELGQEQVEIWTEDADLKRKLSDLFSDKK